MRSFPNQALFPDAHVYAIGAFQFKHSTVGRAPMTIIIRNLKSMLGNFYIHLEDLFGPFRRRATWRKHQTVDRGFNAQLYQCR